MEDYKGWQKKNRNYNGIYADDGAGMDEARVVRRIKDKELITPKKRVGSFGIITDDGREVLIDWILARGRTDRRHGYISEQAPHNKYCDSLFESMFKGWN